MDGKEDFSVFNGVPDQFHQFIVSRTALPLPLPLSLPLHISHPLTFSGLNPATSNQVFQSHLLNLHHQSLTHNDEEKEEERIVGGSVNLEGSVRSISEMIDPWTKEEVLALLKIRSNLGNGPSDFIWEHVSRKLAENGFIRSAEKCKEKFEEESKYYNTGTYDKNYWSFNELEAPYKGENPKFIAEKLVKNNGEGGKTGLNLEGDSGHETLENPPLENNYVVKSSNKKKRRRYHKLELLKGFCEEMVNKIIVQQEERHMKILEDVERREEERVAREEAWKKKEMARINKEIEIMEHQHTIACEREATIIEFLKKLTSNPSQNQGLMKNDYLLKTPASPCIIPTQNPNSISRCTTQKSPNLPTSSTMIQPHQNPTNTTQNNPNLPTSSTIALTPQNPNSNTTQKTISNDREDHGKRWPREEVNSLINLRCNLHSSAEEKEGTRVSIWEKVSEGMLQLGYKRSAKKCKEKWENINKYFRKNKDDNKKRSSNSNTCPYFHQLSSLYNQGTLMFPSEGPENRSSSLENHSATPEIRFRPSSDGFNDAIVHGDEDEGEINIVQVPVDFEY